MTTPYKRHYQEQVRNEDINPLITEWMANNSYYSGVRLRAKLSLMGHKRVPRLQPYTKSSARDTELYRFLALKGYVRY